MTLERATANVRHRCKARYRHRGGQRQPGATADRRAGAGGRLSAAPVRGRSALVPLHPGVTGQPTCASFVPIRSVLEFARAQAVTGPECLARPAGNGSCRGPRALERRLGQLQVHLDQTLRRNRTPAASPTLPTSAAGMTAGHAQRCGADLARPPALRRERTSRPPPPNLQTVHPAQGGRCLATATPGMRRQETGTGPPITSPEAPKPGGGLGSTCWNRCEIWRWASRTPAGDRTGKSATGMDVPPPSTAHLSGRGGVRSKGADQAQKDCSVKQSRWTGLTRTGQCRPT